MTKKAQNNIVLDFIKASVLSAFLSFVAMLAIAVLVSLLLGKFKQYEALYPLITVILHCIPGLLSTRLMLKKYSRSLLLVAIAQAAVVSLLLLSFSLGWQGRDANFDMLLPTLAYIFASSVLAVFLPSRKRKKQ